MSQAPGTPSSKAWLTRIRGRSLKNNENCIFSSLITHHSSLITHHSSLITHHSSLITHHSSLITHHSSFPPACDIRKDAGVIMARVGGLRRRTLMKRLFGTLALSAVIGAAFAQAPFTVVSPRNYNPDTNSPLSREKVVIKFPKNSIPSSGYVG